MKFFTKRQSVALFHTAECDEFAVLVVVYAADDAVQLVVAPDAVAPRRVFRVDDLFDLHDQIVFFIDLMLVGQEIIVVDPIGDARQPAGVVDGNARR